MDDDIYANLPKVKKQKVNDVETVKASTVDEKKSTDQPPREQQTLEASLKKLSKFIQKASKVGKAASLLMKLVKTELFPSTQDVFVETFDEMMSFENRHQMPFRSEYGTLFSAMLEAAATTIDIDPIKVENWRFDQIIHNSLFTDDTYQFAKATKTIQQFINEDNLKQPVRRELILSCLDSLIQYHTIPWAKTSVESVFRLVTAKRLLFEESTDRQRVDAWTRAIRTSGQSTTRTEASENRRNIFPVQQDSSSSIGIKVGKHNHPLFNRD